jgi:hypothetical protein
MRMTDVDYNGVLVRVTRLETQNRFWKVAGLMMLLAAVVSRSCLSSGRVTALVCAVCPNNEGERTTSCAFPHCAVASNEHLAASIV